MINAVLIDSSGSPTSPSSCFPHLLCCSYLLPKSCTQSQILQRGHINCRECLDRAYLVARQGEQGERSKVEMGNLLYHCCPIAVIYIIPHLLKTSLSPFHKLALLSRTVTFSSHYPFPIYHLPYHLIPDLLLIISDLALRNNYKYILPLMFSQIYLTINSSLFLPTQIKWLPDYSQYQEPFKDFCPSWR